MLLRSFYLTSYFRRSACCFQTFKDLFGFFAIPFLIGVAKVGAFFISTKFILNFFSKFLASIFSKNCRFFQADGKDKAVIITSKFYFKFFSLFFSLTHSPLKELAFDYRCISKAGRKDKREHFPSKYFLKKVFSKMLKSFAVKHFR